MIDMGKELAFNIEFLLTVGNMIRLNCTLILAAIMAVLAFVLGGWLVKAGVCWCSLACFAVYAYRQRLWGLSLYLFALFLLYLCADILTFDDISFSALLSYIIFCVTLGGCIILARQGSGWLKTFTVLSNTVFIALPAFYITYYVVFAAGATKDIYYSILQTNVAEALEFMRVNGVTKHLPVPVFGIIVITFLLYKYLRKERIVIKQRTQVLLLLALITATGWSDQPRIAKDMPAYTIKYLNRLRLFKRRTSKRDISNISYHATKAGKGETYIVVIGETLNRHHMQIYGYPRRTTPKLAAEKELLVFNNTYSSHILTGLVLARAFTTSTQYDGTEWYEAVSIIDILKMAKVKTFWLSNQDLYGSWLSFGVLLGKQTDYHLHFGDTFYESPHVDGVLLPHAARILQEQIQDNRVIFVHLMGNHSDHCERYPPAYARYKGKLDAAIHGSLAQAQESHQQQINCYDNSVLYNDFVVSQLLTELKKHEGVTGFIYFSDHAIDILRGTKRVTGGFNYEMTSIPMVAWLSQAHRKKYPQVYQNLQNNRDKLFSNDMLYDTLMGIMAIDTNQYNPRNDLSSSVYELKDDEALVLNGKHKYADKGNKKWQQKTHIAALIADGQGDRTIPVQVNSVGKLKEIWRDGSRAFAVDLTHKGACLAVGSSDMCLQEFLSHVDTSKIEKLWLNVKTTLKNDWGDLLRIKTLVPAAKTIVSIGTCHDVAKLQVLHGWQLSCSLAPVQLKGLTAMSAVTLAEQLKRQGVSAISFDARFYALVAEHLVPSLSTDVVFHLHSSASVEELRHAAYWSDQQVQTVAFRYQSLFQLPTKAKPKQYAQQPPRP